MRCRSARRTRGGRASSSAARASTRSRRSGCAAAPGRAPARNARRWSRGRRLPRRASPGSSFRSWSGLSISTPPGRPLDADQPDGRAAGDQLDSRRLGRELPQERIEGLPRHAVAVGNVGRQAHPSAVGRPRRRMGADGAARVDQRCDPDALHRRDGARQDRVGAGDLVRGGVRPPLDERDPQAGEAVQPRRGTAADARADDRYVECSHARHT